MLLCYHKLFTTIVKVKVFATHIFQIKRSIKILLLFMPLNKKIIHNLLYELTRNGSK
jgi:hypothetical protein